MRHIIAWVLPLGLGLSSAGCTQEQLVSPTAKLGYQDYVESRDKPFARPHEKRPPKPETAVAFAELKISVAETAQRTIDRVSAALAKAESEERLALEKQRQQAVAILNDAYRSAQALYEQALSLDPKCAAAHLGLARLYEKQGNLQLAVEQYQRAVQLYPQDARLWFGLGMTFGKLKHWEQAVTALKRATDLEPANLEYATNYGWCLARCGRDEESWNVFRRHGGDAKAYYRLALMAKHLGKNEHSKQYLTMALQIDPQLAEASELLASLERPVVTQDAEGPAVVPAAHVAPVAPAQP
jgi:Tfp pilus assembly protein PilF